MSLHEAFLALESLNRARRLLDLDDLWTHGLEAPASGDERLALAEIGRQMQALLFQFRGEVVITLDLALRDREGFETIAERAIMDAPLTEVIKEAIRDTYREFGWVAETEIAVRYIEQYSDREAAEISKKVSDLLAGSHEQG